MIWVLCISFSLSLWCAADAIDENYGVAVVFHGEDTEEGGKTDTVVEQEEDPMEVSTEGCMYVYV